MNERKRISERGFETRLRNILDRVAERKNWRIETFEDHGVLTMNRGLVVGIPNGQEFQLTIVESAR